MHRQRGNMALAGALLLLPLSLLAGLAIDIGRILLARDQLQQAVTAAAMASALDAKGDADAAAGQLFKANVASAPGLTVTGFATHLSDDGRVEVAAAGQLRTSFMALAGRRWQRVTVRATASAMPPER